MKIVLDYTFKPQMLDFTPWMRLGHALTYKTIINNKHNLV